MDFTFLCFQNERLKGLMRLDGPRISDKPVGVEGVLRRIEPPVFHQNRLDMDRGQG
jgi:hypothetical protein